MAKTTTIKEVDDSDEPLEEFPEHPLFPLVDNEKSYEVSYIHVTRFELGRQKWGPAVAAQDLMSENDILNRWGGGEYILVARAASKVEGIPGRIKKHRRLLLPGNPKPLSPDPTPEEKNLASPQTEAPKQQTQNGNSLGDMQSIFALMLQMNQQSAQRSSEQSQQFMQMFMGMMSAGKSDIQALTQMMLSMTSQNQQAMTQLLTAVLANRGGGPEEMAKYAELLRSLGMGAKTAEGGEKASESLGAMLENAADIAHAVVQLKQGGMAPPVAVQASPAPVAAPQGHPGGGASALLRGMG